MSRSAPYRPGRKCQDCAKPLNPQAKGERCKTCMHKPKAPAPAVEDPVEVAFVRVLDAAEKRARAQIAFRALPPVDMSSPEDSPETARFDAVLDALGAATDDPIAAADELADAMKGSAPC